MDAQFRFLTANEDEQADPPVGLKELSEDKCPSREGREVQTASEHFEEVSGLEPAVSTPNSNGVRVNGVVWFGDEHEPTLGCERGRLRLVQVMWDSGDPCLECTILN